MPLTDPHEALVSFQEFLPTGELALHACEQDPNLYLHADEPAPGFQRLTYVHIEAERVTALANFVMVAPIDGLPCFEVAYAVPPDLRLQGRATAVLSAAIREMEAGLARANIEIFYVVAIVGPANLPGQKLAQALISNTPTTVTYGPTAEPALKYLARFGTKARPH